MTTNNTVYQNKAEQVLLPVLLGKAAGAGKLPKLRD